jgi:methionyl-tRNA formyltransferase
MKLNILCDNKNSWFWDTSENFLQQLSDKGHEVNLCTSETDIENADVSVFISCMKIVSQNGLEKSNSNIVCHPSDLPKGRGFSPIAWELLNDSNEIIFTLFEADENVDNGKIYKKESLKLNGTELNNEIKNLQAKKTFSMILDYIDSYPENDSYEQLGDPTYFPRRTNLDSELDIDKSIRSQFNLFRVVDNKNYPAFFMYKSKKYILKIEEDN